MTFAKPNLYSDAFTQGPTDSGVWHQNGEAIKVKITTSSQQLDVGCILKGTLTSTGIGSASAPGFHSVPEWNEGHLVRGQEPGNELEPRPERRVSTAGSKAETPTTHRSMERPLRRHRYSV